jgi:hypothetical protein
MYPWPIADADAVWSEALESAMDYLQLHRAGVWMKEVQATCAG